MSQHHFLPTLIEGDPVPSTTRHAFWKDQNLSLLRSVEQGIAVDGTVATRGISSVPDVWARAVLFRAMLNPNHPLHAQAVQEWRGLLSLLALREVFHYDVKLVPVNLTDAGDGVARTRLVRALARLAPPAVDLQMGVPYAWTDTMLITLAGKPIGALSPGSLVFPAIGYEQHLHGGNVDQLRDADGRFKPPANPETQLMLAEWVYGFYESIRTTLGTDESAQTIGKLLLAWRSELLREVGLPDSEIPDAPGVKSSSLPVGVSAQTWSPLGNYAVYQSLLAPLVQDDSSMRLDQRSSIFLQFDRPAPLRVLNGHPLVTALVVHEDTLTDAAQVWGPVRRSTLGEDVRTILQTHFREASGTVIGGQDLSRQGVIWIRPEKFFLADTLIGAPEGIRQLLPDAEGQANGGGEYLLPFRKEILEFYTPEEIERVLRPSFSTLDERTVKFQFFLPVGSPGTSKTDLGSGVDTAENARAVQSRAFVTVSRTYRVRRDGQDLGDDGQLHRSTLPAVELFPRYLGPTWKRYYLFQNKPEDVVAKPFSPRAEHAQRRRSRPLDNTGAEHSALLTEMYGDDPFPDGVELFSAGSGRPLGLILTPRDPFENAGLTGTMMIGIDFGTSNTNVYGKLDSNPAEAWTLNFPEFLRPLTVYASVLPNGSAQVNEAERNAYLRTFFVPNAKVELPFSTLLDVTIDDAGRAQGAGRMLLDYNLFFPAIYAWPRTTRYNLKWEKDQRRVTKEFLESLFFLLMLRVTKNRYYTVHLRCTYPKSFSLSEKQTLQREYKDVFERIVGDSEHAILAAEQDGRPDMRHPKFLNEGFAAAKYFSSDDVDARYRAERQRSVGVDVGGGTSDIALIYRENIVYDTSVRLAGGQIARYVQARPRLQETLFSKEAAAALRAAGTNRELFGAIFNLVLRREDAEIRRRLVDYGQGGEVLPLRHLIALQFGAVAFYVGTVLAAAARSGLAPELGAELDERGISVHWGGNASRLLGWVDLGEFSPGGMAASLLNALLHFSLHDYELPNRLPGLMQVLSHAPKAEAAGGGVVSNVVEEAQEATLGGGGASSIQLDDLYATRPGEDRPKAASLGIVSGETLLLSDGTPVGPLDEITPSLLFTANATRLQSVSGERFTRFVQLFNALGERVGLLNASTRMPADESTRLHVTGKAKDDYVKMQSLPEGERYVEPVFIAEARHLIELVVAQRNS